jgi:uncharacterized protein Usg
LEFLGISLCNIKYCISDFEPAILGAHIWQQISMQEVRREKETHKRYWQQVLEELSAHLGWLTMRNREHDYDV